MNVSALGGLDGTSTPATPRLPCVEGSWPPPGAVTTDKTHTQSHCPGQQGRPPESRACDQVGRSLSHVTRVEWRPLGQHGKHTPRTLGHVLQDRHHAACDKKWERKLAQCLRDYRVTAAENVMYGARRGDRSGTHFERARPKRVRSSARHGQARYALQAPPPLETSSLHLPSGREELARPACRNAGREELGSREGSPRFQHPATSAPDVSTLLYT